MPSDSLPAIHTERNTVVASRSPVRLLSGVAVCLFALPLMGGCSSEARAKASASTDSGALAPAPNAAIAKAKTDRKEKIESHLTGMMTGKGIVTRSVTCPEDSAEHFTNKCSLLTAQGEKAEATCNGDNDQPNCRLDSAIVDVSKVAGRIRDALAKKRRARVADVSCPEGPMVKAVSERFYCKATVKKKVVLANVTVTDLDGNVKFAFQR